MTHNGEPVTDGITSGVEVRKQRGLEIAAKYKVVRRQDGRWSVPSQSGSGRYTVCVGHHRCTCPDFELRGCKCKHQWAVEFVQSREQNGDGTETITQRVDHTTLWSKMYHLYHFKKDEFLPHYHKRSNVESTFMAIKAKFGDAVRSRNGVAQINEVLCKVLCHNVCVVIQSMYELGIQPQFGMN